MGEIAFNEGKEMIEYHMNEAKKLNFRKKKCYSTQDRLERQLSKLDLTYLEKDILINRFYLLIEKELKEV